MSAARSLWLLERERARNEIKKRKIVTECYAAAVYMLVQLVDGHE